MKITGEQIPLDVIFDIFTILPVKSLVRFRCISKSCSSIITNQDFAKMHKKVQDNSKNKLDQFPSTTTIIISCSTELQSAQMFFSSELHARSRSASAIHLKTIPPRLPHYTTHSVNGIICMDFGLCATIFNPSTREDVTLPFVCPLSSPFAGSTIFCVNWFGFDPITQCYKVLNSWAVPGKSTEYRVFTLGTNNNSWRLLGGGPQYFPERESIYINGIIYFKCHYSSFLFGFHVHNEKFLKISFPKGFLHWKGDLIQYAGQLGIVNHTHFVRKNSIDIWVLENLTQKWVCYRIFFPTLWKEIESYENFFVVGTIHAREILLAPRTLMKHFCVYIYNLDSRRLRRIELSGLPEYRPLDFSSNGVAITYYEENILSLQ